MIVWIVGRKIIKTVLCCVVYDSCAQWYAQTCEQFRFRIHFRVLFVRC